MIVHTQGNQDPELRAQRKAVFISYATGDNKKKNLLIEILRPNFECISVEDKKDPAIGLAQKVKKNIDSSNFFVPILTEISIHSQWVNQEIGYAEAKDKKILPIVEQNIIGDLKGFIHNQIDLPFKFKQQGRANFSKACKSLAAHLLELEEDKVGQVIKVGQRRVSKFVGQRSPSKFIGDKTTIGSTE